MPTVGVDFFRVDRSGATRRLLVTAALLVALGATAIGAHLVRRVPASLSHLLSLGGGLLVLVGLVLGFGAMAMLLFENVYLLITADGLVFHENGKEIQIAWGDLERVGLDDAIGFVVFARQGGESLRWFAGEAADAVLAKVEQSRRKALHGLLKPA